MSIQKAYNNWAVQYDSNNNKTRDLEALALRQTLAGIEFDCCLEIGCGTGKNTEWLVTKAKHITAVDLSPGMLEIARKKISSEKVDFTEADILDDWQFANKQYNLVSFSLVLEHIEDLEPVFGKISNIIAPGGYVYAGELHPFKQYSGSKARFDTGQGVEVVTCFNHHLTDFTNAARVHGFSIEIIHEYFDDDDRSNLPRILAILFRKI